MKRDERDVLCGDWGQKLYLETLPVIGNGMKMFRGDEESCKGTLLPPSTLDRNDTRDINLMKGNGMMVPVRMAVVLDDEAILIRSTYLFFPVF